MCRLQGALTCVTPHKQREMKEGMKRNNRTFDGCKFSVAVASKAILCHCCASPQTNENSHKPSDRVQDEALLKSQNPHTYTHLPVHAYLTNMAKPNSQSVLGGNEHQSLLPHEVNNYN